MNATYTIASVATTVEFSKAHDTTFIWPVAEKFTMTELAAIIMAAEGAGRSVVGGHEFSVAIAGNVFVAE